MTYDRYCHLYTEWEIEMLLNEVGHEFECEVIDRGYDKGNWYVTIRKLGDAYLDLRKTEEETEEEGRQEKQK